MSSFRVIPPEQQAEADELATALSELQAATMHEWQEVVGGVQAAIEKQPIVTGSLKWHKRVSFQNAMNDNIAEWKTIIAEKTQKLVCEHLISWNDRR